MLDTLRDFQVYSTIKTMNEQQNSLITVKEAAKIKGVSDKAIYNLMKRGRLNFEEVSGKKLIKREDVENYVEGKRGRPSKIIVQGYKPTVEMFLSKNRNPENHFSSFFSIFYNLRRLYRDNESDSDQPTQGVFDYFTDDNFKRNKRKFRLKFRHCERKFQTIAFLNSQIVVERVYVNPNLQAFFQYVLFSPEIQTDNFSIDMLFIRFMSEFHNDFSLIINDLQQQVDSQKSQKLGKNLSSIARDSLIEKAEKAFKRAGRKNTYRDDKGNIKGGATSETKRAIRYFSEGMNGKEIGEKLFEKLKYKLRNQSMVRVAKNLEYQFKTDSRLFKRPFDLKDFKRSIYEKKKVAKNSII
jgi:excisionase family DNA binding protein